MDVYVQAKKAVLVQLLEVALENVRASTEGHVSVQIYSTVDDSVVNFSDEYTADDGPGRVTIEEG